MNAPLIITEMNKPSSIIISSSAPSVPRYPRTPPQPYFCLFFHVTAWAGLGWGGVGWTGQGRWGGCCVSTVWQHGPGNSAGSGIAACALGTHRQVCVRAHAGRVLCFSAYMQHMLVSGCANTSAFVREAGCEAVGVCLCCLDARVCLSARLSA